MLQVASYDNWHHYALSWDGRTVNVYIDSVLAGQRTPFPGTVTDLLAILTDVALAITHVTMFICGEKLIIFHYT